jgi:anti-anti-sigma factor
MKFTAELTHNGNDAVITLNGQLDASAAPLFREKIEAAFSGGKPERLILLMEGLEYMASAGLRALVFAKQKAEKVEILVVNAQEAVMETIEMTGFHHSVTITDSYPSATT